MDAHYQSVTQSLCSKQYPWPLDLILAQRQRRQKIKWLWSKQPVLKADVIYAQVDDALSSLSTALGDQLYLFGPKPSHCDASLFAFLHVTLNILSRSKEASRLRERVLSYDNLVKYAKRLWTTWYFKLK